MKKPSNSQVRIIGGQWKRRSLSFWPSMIYGQHQTVSEKRYLIGYNLTFKARCLDMFAGSGALGVEALSRGAAECVFLKKILLKANICNKPLSILVNNHRY